MPGKTQPAERRFSFDAFLSHNSKNKPEVRKLKARLVAAGLKIWFDEDELRPGIPWQELLEAGIMASQSVVVVVGADGLGPWEDEEMQGALRLAVNDKRPVIPGLLPGAPRQPKLPMFLGNRTWVDLRNGLTAEGLDRLQWGITGVKPPRRDGQTSTPAEDSAVELVEQETSGETSSEPRTPTLNEILPGTWQVQILQPTGFVEQMRQELFPNGTFRGEEMTPMGVRVVEGQWQANPFTHQVGMQGRQTCGFQMGPFAVMVQVARFDRQQVEGMTNVGERVVWQRIGAFAPTPQPMVDQAPTSRPTGAVRGGGGLNAWREKLDYLQQQQAITADPAQKFALKKQIEEAQAKIQELGE